LPNIAAVKEASGLVTQIAEICATMPGFTVLSGDDAMTLPAISVGSVGVISVASNAIPKEMADLTRAALDNDWPRARGIYQKYLALMQANFIESNPMPVKALLAMMGRIEENYRLPMVTMQPNLRAKLEAVARACGVVK
jgi:4-hydroxy-tetrahydrodipicolinate synthase